MVAHWFFKKQPGPDVAIKNNYRIGLWEFSRELWLRFRHGIWRFFRVTAARLAEPGRNGQGLRGAADTHPVLLKAGHTSCHY
jgi:hypothetical protein